MWLITSRADLSYSGVELEIPTTRSDATGDLSNARIYLRSLIVPFTNDAGHMIGIAAIMRDATTRLKNCVRRAASSLLTRPRQGRNLPHEHARRPRRLITLGGITHACR